jgi:fucose permease
MHSITFQVEKHMINSYRFYYVLQSKMFMILGAGALLVQGILLRALLSFLGEARLLAFGLVASTFQQCILVFAARKWHAFFAVSLGSLSSVTFPTISSIKANNSLDHEQGSVQGALYGARSVASGVGPLAFAFLFSAFTKSDSPLPFFPGAPFVLGTVIMIGTTVLACSLEPGAGGNTGVLFSQKQNQQDANDTMNSNDEEASTSLLSKTGVEK